MAFRYKYKAFDLRYRLFGLVKNNRRNVTILSVLAILVFSFYLITSNVTAYITYTEDLEDTLNMTKIELSNTKNSLNECSTNLANTQDSLSICDTNLNRASADLSACSSERAELTNQKSQLESELSTCTSERDDYRSRLESQQSAFNNVVRTSVKAICCSFSDIDTGATINWGITDNRIVCTGSYEVNCATGETNY